MQNIVIHYVHCTRKTYKDGFLSRSLNKQYALCIQSTNDNRTLLYFITQVWSLNQVTWLWNSEDSARQLQELIIMVVLLLLVCILSHHSYSSRVIRGSSSAAAASYFMRINEESSNYETWNSKYKNSKLNLFSKLKGSDDYCLMGVMGEHYAGRAQYMLSMWT